MSNPNRFADWARRQGSRPAPAQPAPVVAAPAPIPPPAPPPGYGWMMHPQYGMVMVPLAPAPQAPGYMAPPPAPAFPEPPRQPQGTIPYQGFAPAFAGAPGRVAAPPPPVRTCELVKPGNRDTYAELLQGVPDLVPASSFDAMAGCPSPETQAELQGMPEYQQAMMSDAPQSFPRQGVGVPLAGVQELGKSN